MVPCPPNKAVAAAALTARCKDASTGLFVAPIPGTSFSIVSSAPIVPAVSPAVRPPLSIAWIGSIFPPDSSADVPAVTAPEAAAPSVLPITVPLSTIEVISAEVKLPTYPTSADFNPDSRFFPLMAEFSRVLPTIVAAAPVPKPIALPMAVPSPGAAIDRPTARSVRGFDTMFSTVLTTGRRTLSSNRAASRAIGWRTLSSNRAASSVILSHAFCKSLNGFHPITASRWQSSCQFVRLLKRQSSWQDA